MAGLQMQVGIPSELVLIISSATALVKEQELGQSPRRLTPILPHLNHNQLVGVPQLHGLQVFIAQLLRHLQQIVGVNGGWIKLFPNLIFGTMRIGSADVHQTFKMFAPPGDFQDLQRAPNVNGSGQLDLLVEPRGGGHMKYHVHLKTRNYQVFRRRSNLFN